MCAGAGLSDPADRMAGMSPDVLAGLDPEQRLVAEALGGPVVVHAGAGTGKTRAITHRIAYAVLTGRHSAGTGLAVTFTNRAAGEMRGRLAQLGVPMVTVRTFHAAALSQLRYFWPHTVGGPFPDLVASKAGLVGRACRELGIPSAKPLVRDLAAEIEWAGSSLVSAGDYARAIRGYEALLGRYPHDRHAALAALELGRLKRTRAGDPLGAAEALQQAAEDAELNDDALAQLVLSYDQAGDRARCLAAQQRYLTHHPNGVHAAEVRTRCRVGSR